MSEGITAVVVIMILAAVFGGYIVTSLLLLRFPKLLHKKKEIRFRATHISHRGGAGENLENTLAAFQHAAEAGTEMLELDCHLTLDGQVVVCHDEDLFRTTGHQMTVRETLYEDLPLISEQLRLDFNYGHTTHGGGDRRIPLLRQVYEQFPNMPINVDIKVDSTELIQKVSEMTKEFRREPITVWGNRSTIVTNKCFDENPNIHLLFSLKRVIVLVLLFYTGLLPFVPLRESFYEIIMPSIILKPGRLRTPFTGSKRALVRFFDFLLMSKFMFRHLNERGIQTYLWVLNDEEEFEQALKCGVTGIMTDFPTKLSQFLQNNPSLLPGHRSLLNN